MTVFFQFRWWALLLCVTVTAFLNDVDVIAQDRVIRAVGPGGVVVQEGVVVEQPAQPQSAPGQPPGSPMPPGAAKPAEGDKPKSPDAKGGAAPLTARPTKPPKPANPEELKNLKPDADGRVKFNLKGQPWSDVLEWLAETSGKSLDWQELPPDYLNLVTQQTYSIDEARDLLNRHLLARGFTMLTHGETISVVSVAKLNPGIVPRVEPGQLAKLPDHDFVKTSFSLEWLLSDQAESELKPMLSPNGKLTHLTNTNRLEAMDSVRNLREIWEVIQQEQSGDKQEGLVREFKLTHVKSMDVLDQLHILLGVTKPSAQKRRRGDSGGGGGGGMMNPNMMQEMQQQMQQQMQQMQQAMQQQQPGAAGAAAARKPGEIRLLANIKENSILANAPPDKMAIISQAIKTLDVQPGDGEHLLQNVQRMQVYRLSGIEPAALVELLEEVGNLDPMTKLQVDGKNKSIVAYAPLADHMTIKMLVERLDGTGRKFHMFPLRKLEADYVAGTIEFMMGGAEKEKKQTNRNPFFFDYYDQFNMGGRQQTESSDKFRIDADVENNRLLLWANDIELREIENLLVKLGELSLPGGNRSTRRTLENLDTEDSAELLEKLRRLWPDIAPNELIIEDNGPPKRERHPLRDDEPAADQPTTPAKATPAKPKSSKKPAAVKATATPKSASRDKPASDRIALQPKAREFLQVVARQRMTQLVDTDQAEELLAVADLDTTSSDATPEADRPLEQPRSSQPVITRKPPPIRIRRGADGHITIESLDTVALDQLEEILREATPPRRDFKVFYLKYPSTWAYSVELNLKDFFDAEKKKTSTYNPYWGMRMGGNDDKESTRSLSKRKPLRFISDSDSGTIIVQGASPEQLKTIEELINIYDQPPATDGKQVRKTQTFTLRYGKAPVISEAIKDVYRDLLSANDKAYQGQQQPGKEGQKPPERNYTFIYGGGGEGDDKGKQQETPVKFKGLISLGVDEVSNTIIVSAPESVLENVAELIERLDTAARPTNSVQVLRIDTKINSAELQKRLSKIFKPQPKPQPQRPNQPQPPQQPMGDQGGEEMADFLNR